MDYKNLLWREKAKFEKDNWGKYLKGKLLLFMHSLFWPLSDIVLGFELMHGFENGGFSRPIADDSNCAAGCAVQHRSRNVVASSLVLLF